MKRSVCVLAAVALLGLTACEDSPVEPEPIALDAALFNVWEIGGDGVLDSTEFRGGFVQQGVFRDLDKNGDLVLGDDEWDDDDFGTLASFDADGDAVIDPGEFYDGMFDLFDSNDDLVISETEFAVGIERF